MPRENLLGLIGEVDRLLGAGSASASGNEQLIKRGKTLRELGKKVPALNPVADAVEKVTQASGKQVAPAFLDLLGKTCQVRASLSSAGVPGELKPFPPTGPWQTNQSIRDLFPVQEALESAGSGREQALKEAIDRKITDDMRLVGVLLKTLEDSYAPIADLATEQALVPLGKGIVPELEKQLDLQGKTADTRRLKLISRLDKPAGLRLCRKALQEGGVALRVQALECLPDVVEDAREAEKAGLELYKDKKAEVRAAAILALRSGRGDETLDTLLAAIKDRSKEVQQNTATALAALPHPQATPRVLALLQEAVDDLAEDKPKAKKESKPAKGAKPTKKAAAAAKTAVDEEVQKWMARHQNALDRASYLIHILGERKDTDRTPAARAILPVAESKDPEVRLAALQALGNIGPVLPEVLPALLRAVQDSNTNVKVNALNACQRLKPAEREPIFLVILDLATRPKVPQQVRYAAFQLLPGHFAAHRSEVLKVLKDALKSKDDGQIYAACEAAGQVGPDAAELLPEMLDRLKTTSYTYSLSPAFPKIDPDGTRTFPVLCEMLDGTKNHHQQAAIQTLVHYGPKALAVRPALERLIMREDSYVRYYAESVLRQIEK